MICSGCDGAAPDTTSSHVCIFVDKGFSIDSTPFTPCGVRYHDRCIRLGLPFTTRLPAGKGLQYPPAMAGLPFVCELCTVRANLRRELSPDPKDMALLALERMRIVDLAHFWARSSLSKNLLGLRTFAHFQEQFGLPKDVLGVAASTPPVDVSIPVFWAMQHKAIQPSKTARSGRVSFNALRGIRTSISAYNKFTKALLSPTDVFCDGTRRLLGAPYVSCTDNVASQLTSKGLAARLGTATRPSKVLLSAHIHWNQQYRLHCLSNGLVSLQNQYLLVAAQCAELFGWLGWLRSGECFGVCRTDVILISPLAAASHGLPVNVGVVLLQLLAETKSSRTLQADVVVSWRTSSGLHLGRWMSLLLSLMDRLGLTQPSDKLFQDPWTGKPWTSGTYRHFHLFPLLRLQREAGDPFLLKFDGSPGNTLADHFTMFHLYRRGGRSHVVRRRDGCVRAATPLETYLHGRWRFLNTGREAVDLAYIEPTLEDRVYLTLFCL